VRWRSERWLLRGEIASVGTLLMVRTMVADEANGCNQPDCGGREGRGGQDKQGNTGQKNDRLANGWLLVAFVVVAVVMFAVRCLRKRREGTRYWVVLVPGSVVLWLQLFAAAASCCVRTEVRVFAERRSADGGSAAVVVCWGRFLRLFRQRAAGWRTALLAVVVGREMTKELLGGEGHKK
jgi:hypothetical protein